MIKKYLKINLNGYITCFTGDSELDVMHQAWEWLATEMLLENVSRIYIEDGRIKYDVDK